MTRAAVITVALAAVVWAVAPALAQAAPGELDPSFGGGTGSVATFYGHVNASAVAIQPDGKIVVVGSNSASGMLLSRYNQNGGLDSSFGGGDGQVTAAAAGTVIYLEPSGKILIGGIEEGTSQRQAVLSRFDPDGSIDTTFGGGTGTVRTDFGAETEDRPYTAAFGPDGKLYLAGVKYTDLGNGYFSEEFAVAAYNPDGSSDTAFDGPSGIVHTDFGGIDAYALAVAVQPNGKLLVGGASSANFAVARYNPDGSLDASFGDNGEVVTSSQSSGGGILYSLAVQPDGKILALGERGLELALLRYDEDGSLDASFGTGGAVYLDPERDFGASPETGAAAYGLALEADGRILVSGGLYNYYDNTFATLVARYNPNGVLDHGFGSDGVATTPAGGFGAALQDLALEPDGSIVAVGGTGGMSSEYLVQRYLGGGELTSGEPPADEPGATGGGTTPVGGGDSGGNSPAPAASSSAPSVAVPAIPQPSALKAKPLICHKGFKRQKVHGKAKCVKVKRKRHRR